jgi:hypothetical protein
MTNPLRQYSHHNKTGKTNHDNPQTQQHQTKTDIHTTEMTPKTCTQDNKTPTTQVKSQRPMDPNTNPSPNTITRSLARESTQVIGVLQQGENKKMEKTNSLTQINCEQIHQWKNLTK